MKKDWEKGIAKILISEDQIKKRVKELGEQITREYKSRNEELVVICLLKGSILFMSDLIREIKIPLVIDFMGTSSYGNEFQAITEVKITKELDEQISGKDVLIVEDIIDTGRTLTKIKEILSTREPKSIKICSLLDKPSRREVKMKGDYIGFEIEDVFVLGYGLDFKQEYRNIPYVAVMGKDF
ncbi:MAG: hypoxanthine phosphoribosyltransferase [Fusobacteriaceae bacterium]